MCLCIYIYIYNVTVYHCLSLDNHLLLITCFWIFSRQAETPGEGHGLFHAQRLRDMAAELRHIHDITAELPTFHDVATELSSKALVGGGVVWGWTPIFLM